MIGTARYMSPEQAQGESCDHRSDIFSLGAVLYEMLTGSPAFPGDTPLAALAPSIELEPVPLATLCPAASPQLVRLVQRCLDKEPTRRFQSASDLAFHLETLAEPPATAATGPTVRALGRRRWLAALAAAIVGGAASLGIVALRSATDGTRPAAAPIRATIDLPEDIFLNLWGHSVALSPDGSLLALSVFSTADGQRHLYLRALDALQFDMVPGTEGASYPFWAPDGRALGFFAGGKLKRLDLPGKVVRSVCDAPDGGGGSWSSRGVIAIAPARSGGLLEVPAGGGIPTPLTAPRQPLLAHRLPHFLPDGRHLLYSVARGDAASRGVWYFDADTRQEKRLLPEASDTQFVAPGYLAFVRDGNLMLQPFDANRASITGTAVSLVESVHVVGRGNPTSNFSFSLAGRLVYQPAGRGRQRLAWIGRDGERLSIAAEVSGLGNLTLSPDGRQALFPRVDEQNRERLFLLDLERGVQSALTRDNVVDSIAWSPDGREVAYSEFSGAGFRLQRQNLSRGEPPVTLLEDPAQDFHPTGWSPDGKTLVLTRKALEDAQSDVVALELGGERRLRALVAGPAAESGGQVSPGGGWLAFLSEEPGRRELYVASFPMPGRRWPITSGGVLIIGRWLSENELSYLAADGRIYRVRLTLRGDRLEAGTPRRAFGGVNWLEENLESLEEDPATGRLLVAERIGRPGGGVLVLLTDWKAALARR